MPDRKPKVLDVASPEELIAWLHELAVKYRDTVDGGAHLSTGEPAIWVSVHENGERQLYQFRHTTGEPQALYNALRQLRDLGFIFNGMIEFNKIVSSLALAKQQREEKERQEEEKRRKEQEESRRHKVQMRRMILGPLISGLAATGLGFLLSFWGYNARLDRLEEKVSGLRNDVSALHRQVGPASQPAERP